MIRQIVLQTNDKHKITKTKIVHKKKVGGKKKLDREQMKKNEQLATSLLTSILFLGQRIQIIPKALMILKARMF